MARKKLAKLGRKKRYTFVGHYTRCGYKIFNRGFIHHVTPTLLLKNVTHNGQPITGHLWFNYTKSFQRLGQLKPGDKIQFCARVNSYLKGYGPMFMKTLDYSLSYPSKIKLLTKKPFAPLPVGNNDAMIGYIMNKNRAFYLSNNRPFDYSLVDTYLNWRKRYQAEAKKMKTKSPTVTARDINSKILKQLKKERKRAKIQYHKQANAKYSKRTKKVKAIAKKHHVKILNISDGIYNKGEFQCPKGHVFHTIPYFFVTTKFDILCPVCLHAKWHVENVKRRYKRQQERDAARVKKQHKLDKKLNEFKHYCKQHGISYVGQWKFKNLDQRQRFACPNGMLFISTYRKIMNGYRYPLYKKYLTDAKFRHKCLYKANGTKRNHKQRQQFESAIRRKFHKQNKI